MRATCSVSASACPRSPRALIDESDGVPHLRLVRRQAQGLQRMDERRLRPLRVLGRHATCARWPRRGRHGRGRSPAPGPPASRGGSSRDRGWLPRRLLWRNTRACAYSSNPSMLAGRSRCGEGGGSRNRATEGTELAADGRAQGLAGVGRRDPRGCGGTTSTRSATRPGRVPPHLDRDLGIEPVDPAHEYDAGPELTGRGGRPVLGGREDPIRPCGHHAAFDAPRSLAAMSLRPAARYDIEASPGRS